MLTTVETTRFVEVAHHRGEDRPRWLRGSGFVIEAGLVITAAHNLGGSPREVGARGTLVRGLREEDWSSADVIVRDDELDLALLETPTPDFGRVRVGRIDRDPLEEVPRVIAGGFPRFKRPPDQPPSERRRAAQASGSIETLEDQPEVSMTLKLGGSGPRAADGGGSPWEGMSGAGVVIGPHLIGVVTEHHGQEGTAALRFVPLALLAEADLPPWPEHERLRAKLDIGRLPDLPVVNRRPPRPGEDDRPAPAPLSPSALEVRSAYLRWMRETHRHVSAFLAGQELHAPITGAPMPDRLVRDVSTQFALEREAAEVDRAASTAGTDASAVIASHPVATFLGPPAPVDSIDLEGGESLTARELMDSRWRSVVLGDPGSGKTTVVRRIAYDAGCVAGDEAAGAQRRLPVLCRAVDLAGPGGLPLEERAIQAGWREHKPAVPESGDQLDATELRRVVQEAVARRSLLLIVDGLDEVPTLEQRRALVGEIGDFVDRAGTAGARTGRPTDDVGTQVLVTSRKVGYHAAPLDERFEQRWIAPLHSDVMRALGAYWLGAHGAAVARSEAETAELEASLRRRLEDPSVELGPLASNAFLLTLIVSQVLRHGARAQVAPGGSQVRADLFDALVESALERLKDREPGADGEALVRLQCALAYEIHRESRTGLVAWDELEPLVLRACAAAGVSAIEPAATVRLALAMGLLTERGRDAIGFLHLAVEEHLAGRWLDERSPDGAGFAAHLGDPRWVEPLTLGLGRISRLDPPRLRVVLATLRTAAGPAVAAALLGSALDDLVAVDPEDVADTVAAVVASDLASGAAADLVAPFVAADHRAVGAAGRRRAVEVMASAIGDDRPAVSARAAAIVAALGGGDPRLLDALSAAQHRDGPEHGWPALRALMIDAGRRDRAAAHGNGVPAAFEKDLAERRAAITGLVVRVELPADDRPRPSLRPRGPARHRLPLRQALLDNSALVDRIEEDFGWSRLVLLLYGGTSFADVARWDAEQERLLQILHSPTASAGERLRAARQLDAVAQPAVDSPAQPQSLNPALIVMDSPLTEYLVGWLEDGVESAAAAGDIWALHLGANRDVALRADALLGWAACTREATEDVLATLAAGSGGPLGDRMRWRLARARFLLGDTLARLPTAGIVEHRDGLPDEPPDLDRRWHLVRATASLGRVRPFPLDGPGGASAASFASRVGYHDNYDVAVMLDTVEAKLSGGGARLLTVIDEVRAAGARVTAGRWPLDPLAPSCARDPGAALPAIAAFSEDINFNLDFLRLWMLIELAPHLAAAGAIGEARSLVTEASWRDPEYASNVMLALERAERDANDGDEERPRLAVVGTSGDDDRDRAADAAELARALARAHRTAPPRERASALAACLKSLRNTEPVDTALILGALPTSAEMDPESRAERQRIVRGLPNASLRAVADGLLSAPLLDAERRARAEPRGRPPFEWAVLTAAALCHDLAVTGPGDAGFEWRGLLVPERRAATLDSVRRPRSGLVQLDDDATDAIDDLVDDGQAAVVAEVLTHVAADRLRPELSSWRRAANRRIADLATLMAIEVGPIDAEAVEPLVRLLADSDDRVRLRAGIASSTLGRGVWTRPRFRYSELGPEGMEAMASALVRLRAEGRPESTDLGWALSDLVVDEPGVLDGALERLDEEAAHVLLASIRQVDGRAVRPLVELLDRLDDGGRLRLLYSLQAMASQPDRSKVESHLPTLAEAGHTWVAEGTDPVAAAAATLFGTAAVPSAENLTLMIELAERSEYEDDVVSIAACEAAGRLLAGVGRSEPQAAEAAEVLWRAAETGPGPVGIAAVAGLARSGEPVEATTRPVGAATVLWGLIAAVNDELIGPAHRAGVRKAADFVVDPPHVAAGERTAHTEAVMKELLGQLPEALAAARQLGGDEPDPLTHWWLARPDDALAVAAELAARQPAALRVALAGASGELHRQLCSIVTGTPRWVMRRAAVRIVALVGPADGAAIDALLHAAGDTATVRDSMFEVLPYLDGVEEEGVRRLLDGIASGPPATAHVAISLLTNMLEGGVLSPDQRRAALGTIEQARARSGGGDQIVFEAEGALRCLGTVADEASNALRRLSTSGGSAPDDSAVARLEVADPAGNGVLSLAVATRTPPTDPIRFQRIHIKGSRDSDGLDAIGSELKAAAEAVRSAGCDFRAVLPLSQ